MATLGRTMIRQDIIRILFLVLLKSSHSTCVNRFRMELAEDTITGIGTVMDAGLIRNSDDRHEKGRLTNVAVGSCCC
jgi:hypothetical protein